MNIKPRKSKWRLFGFLLVLILGMGLGGFLVLKSKTTLGAHLEKQLAELFKSESSFEYSQEETPSNQDTDNDGLADWQEEIYKTDPDNPDTDGDGYLDGEEVRAGYDPLKPAPGDKIKTEAQMVNLTSALAEQVLAGILKSNPANPEELAGAVFDQNLANQEGLIDIFPSSFEIPESQIQISSEKDPQAIKNYLLQVTGIFRAIPFFLNSPEDAGLMTGLAIGQSTAIEKLIQDTEIGYENLQNIPVPEEAKEIQKNSLALVLTIKELLEKSLEAPDDPIKIGLIFEAFEEKVLFLTGQIQTQTNQLLEKYGLVLE